MMAAERRPMPQALVVEDSAPMRELIVLALAGVPDLEVVQAGDGLDGLRKLAKSRFDIVLTDINMPILDGLKLVKRLRSDAAYREVPIVIITTEAAEVDRRRALALGATAYLTKPVQAREVVGMVRQLLEERGMGA